jgi:hypothetical protein
MSTPATIISQNQNPYGKKKNRVRFSVTSVTPFFPWPSPLILLEINNFRQSGHREFFYYAPFVLLETGRFFCRFRSSASANQPMTSSTTVLRVLLTTQIESGQHPRQGGCIEDNS